MAKQKISREYVAAAIAEYSARTVSGVEIHPDPEVDDVFAIQAEVAGRGRCHFLLTGWPFRTVLDASLALEEVEFTCWPPAKVGGHHD